MSQHGIFSIGSEAQDQVSSYEVDRENARPSGEVNGEPLRGQWDAADVEGDPPLKDDQYLQRDSTQAGGSVMLVPRSDGEPRGIDTVTNATEETEVADATYDQSEDPQVSGENRVFETAQGSDRQSAVRVDPFQINGFPKQTGNEVMEAAPVAATSNSSDFMGIVEDQDAYEAAKANLEPQQDFAVLPAGIEPDLSAQQRESVSPSVESLQRKWSEQTEQTEHVQAVEPLNTTPSAGANPSSGIQQLELRAIFGVDHMLEVNEILQRARILPGIRNVVVVESREAEAISHFGLAMGRMGLGGLGEMKINSGGGTVDFITEGNTTLAILVEGSYAPGVKETLIIVAREIGKLS